MENKESGKWYFRSSSLVIGFLCVGPLILPLAWSNPHFSSKTKVVISAVVVILSLFLAVVTFNSLKSINNYYQEISKLSP
jgi:hypothetical protein